MHTKLGYGTVRGCYYGPRAAWTGARWFRPEGEQFECDIDLFDAEKDPFPYADEYFSTVLCCELIEHLFHDPMHLMSEVNRILKPGGHLVLTTPNIAALRGVSAILQGYHPGFFHAYIRPSAEGETDARHNREYTPREIHKLLENSGFTVVRLETGPFRDEPTPSTPGWFTCWSATISIPSLRGEGIYAVGQKTGRGSRTLPVVAIYVIARVQQRGSPSGRRPLDYRELRDPKFIYGRHGGHRKASPWAITSSIPETDTLVVDGPRTAPDADIAPGRSAGASNCASIFPPSRGATASSFRGCRSTRTGFTSAARSFC